MHFRLLTALTVAFSATQTHAETSSQDVAANIDELTALCNNASYSVKDLIDHTVIITIPVPLSELDDIVHALTTGNPIMDIAKASPIEEDGQPEICEALEKFVQAQQRMIDALLAKSGILSAIPFARVIRLAIYAMKVGVDKLMFGINHLAPICREQLSGGLGDLNNALDDAISTYS